MHDPPPAILFQRMSFFFWRQAVRRFIFVSQSARNRTELLGSANPDDIVIHNGVKIEPLTLPRVRSNNFVRRFDWSGETIIVGMTGQMTQNKGHHDFIEAARLAISRDTRFRFVIGGRPLDPYYSDLRRRVEEFRLENVISFSGWMPDVREFFEGIDLFVLPSRHDEGFGLVVAEAMERGCVVVATRSGGAVEIVEDGITGHLVDKQAPTQIADKLVTFATDPECRNQIVAKARARIKVKFNQEAQSNTFQYVLEQSLFSHHSGDRLE